MIDWKGVVMNHLYRLIPLLILLPLLAACLSGDDSDSTATAEPAMTQTQPATSTVAPTTAPSATPTTESASSASPTPASQIRPTSTTLPTPTQLPVTRVDATPTAEAAPTAIPAQGVPYELAEQIGQPQIPQAPMDVTFLDDGRVVVADGGRREIQIYGPSFDLLESWPTMVTRPLGGEWIAGSPEQVAVIDDSFYVGIADASGIARYSAGGDLLAQYTFGESSLSLFDLSSGPDGRLYAAVGSFRTGQAVDGYPYGIYVFDSELNPLEIWQSSPVWMPMALAFDADGMLHSLLLRASSNGNVVQPARIVSIDPAAYDAGVWEEPVEFEIEGNFDGLAVTDDGNLVLIEEASNDSRDGSVTVVYIMTEEGQELDRWEVAGHAASQIRTAAGMLMSGSDPIVLADPIGQRVLFLGLDGEVIRELADDPAHLSIPSGIAILPSGEPAVLDVPAREISIFGVDNAEPERYEIDILYFHPAFMFYSRIFAGNDNDLWYIDTNELSPLGLRRVDLATGEIEQFETEELVEQFTRFSPLAGAIGPDGRLYLVLADGIAHSFSVDGEHLERWPATDDSPVENVRDIAVGPDGIYLLWEGVSDEGSGSFVSRWGDDPAESIAFVPSEGDGSATPIVFDIGPDGQIYLLDPFTNEVIIFDASGELISRWSAGDARESQVIDIAVDAEGRVYLTDAKQRAVLVYAPVQ